jgi:hypothetical protein
MGRFRRFIVEYIGNVHFSYHADRRTDWRARELMDWAQEQMEARRLEAAKRRELVDDFRQVMRPGDPASAEVGAIGTPGDGVSERVPDAKGVSRDGPT